jgi:hypothetical protein
MKKVLLAGNSHASGLYKCIQAHPEAFAGLAELYFYVIPGGYGPHLVVDDGRLVLTNSSPNFPPYAVPDTTPGLPVTFFDGFVITALGYVDGGFRHSNPIVTVGVMAEYDPIVPSGILRPMLSDCCYRAVVAGALESQDGFRFLKSLRAATVKPIAVQPFPYLSDEILERPDWKLAIYYRDAEGANRFFTQAKDAALADACARSDAALLEYPDPAWKDRGLTPRHFMRSTSQDMVHSGVEYSALIVEQLKTWVSTL